MTNKNLNDEELEKVTGGSLGQDGADTNGQFSGFINMYALSDKQYTFKELYFVSFYNGSLEWFKAKLVKSFEESQDCKTNTAHDVIITDMGNLKNSRFYKGETTRIYGKNYAVYTTKNY